MQRKERSGDEEKRELKEEKRRKDYTILVFPTQQLRI
jgi:hypothetical protein